MLHALQKDQLLYTGSGRTCQIGSLLGSGGQGEVYEVQMEGQPYALKWYYPEQATREQRQILEDLVNRGAPTPRFLWPIDIVNSLDRTTFGYVMPLRESRFCGIVDMMRRKAEPSFRALATAGYELADSYHQLHARRLCYRDISFGNVFLDPRTGEVRICDNDNVSIAGADHSGVLGTPRFMAPEIVRGEARPTPETDLFSLAVLLFYMFMMHHPLEGRREAEIRCFDLPAMNKLYGFEPIFIWHPANDSNRPVPGLQDNARVFWEVYPEFFKQAFTRVFTQGIQTPALRIQESEWRKIFVELRDSIMYCGHCGAENFYDAERLKTLQKPLCWACKKNILTPPRIRIGSSFVMLNHDSRLYPHHLGDTFNFGYPVAEVERHPQDPSIWGLKNLTQLPWTMVKQDGSQLEVPAGRRAVLGYGTRLQFGSVEGEIRV
ncbi:MAG TPA: protein kinase [Patescibacteria group bacterium]|nr:protein kinase [Patescibacteria group bacterium]